MSKKTFRIILFSLLLLVSVFAIVFFKNIVSGGDLNIKKALSDDYMLVGLEFNGSANKQEFKDVFEKIDTEKLNSLSPTYMVHYEMAEPSKKNNFHVNTFIGYTTKDTSKVLSNGYEYRILRKRDIVRATSVSNLIFQGRIYPSMVTFFSENDIEIDSSYIVEKYWKDNKIEIEMGIK